MDRFLKYVLLHLACVYTFVSSSNPSGFHGAVFNSNIGHIKVDIANGININEKDHQGRTPLAIWAGKSSED